MNNFIPAESYYKIFYIFLLLITLVNFIQANSVELENNGNLKQKGILGVIILSFVILLIGIRPIDGKYFGDMRSYSIEYEEYSYGYELSTEKDKDIAFEFFMKTSSQLIPVEIFFFICTILYVYPMYLVSKRLFKEYWYYSFFMLIISLSFWGYGTNGIRNGIATSFFLLALSSKKNIFTWLWIIFAISFHKSLFIPTLAYIISFFYKNTKTYLKVWFIAIPLSLVLGSIIENFFMGLGVFSDNRITGYFEDDADIQSEFSSLGFRWDFLLYSATGVFAGWYFIIKKQFEDKLYINLYNIYLITNAFWILVIRANFSNRFAYLSWFMLGIIIIYPFLKAKFFHNQHKIIGRIIFFYFLFTFLMNFVLAKY